MGFSRIKSEEIYRTGHTLTHWYIKTEDAGGRNNPLRCARQSSQVTMADGYRLQIPAMAKSLVFAR